MAPRVEPGDVVLTQRTTTAELRTGQVVLVADPERRGGLLLHRLVSFDPAGNLVTRGDANQSDDSMHVAPSAVQGIARLRVPWVGLPSVWRAEGRFGAIALAAAVLAGAAVVVSQGLPRRGGSGSSVGAGAPMTGARRSAVRGAVAVPAAIEEERVSASSAGYPLPPVPPPTGRGGRAAGPAGRRHRPGGDHSGCFDGGRLCHQPGR
jgi:signal peptidase